VIQLDHPRKFGPFSLVKKYLEAHLDPDVEGLPLERDALMTALYELQALCLEKEDPRR